MLYTVNRTTTNALRTLAHAPRVGSLTLGFSRGWDESIDRQKGRFVKRWGQIANWEDAILQGPHLYVSAPVYKTPNSTMLHQQDWSEVDLETLAPDALPTTAYKPTGDRISYDSNYGSWKLPAPEGEDPDAWQSVPVRDCYRVAWRCMAANTGERTLIPALIPPGPAHVDGLFSSGSPASSSPSRALVALCGTLSSLLADYQIRSAPKSTIRATQVSRLAFPPLGHPLTPRLLLRTLRLNCLTEAYAPLWAEVWDEAFREDEWLLGPGYEGTPALGDVEAEWSAATPLRRDLDRRNALVEIDALMATMLGVSAEELCTIYRTQFAVLHGYDQDKYTFDANGRIVPNSVLKVWKKKGDKMGRENGHPPGRNDLHLRPPVRNEGQGSRLPQGDGGPSDHERRQPCAECLERGASLGQCQSWRSSKRSSATATQA